MNNISIYLIDISIEGTKPLFSTQNNFYSQQIIIIQESKLQQQKSQEIIRKIQTKILQIVLSHKQLQILLFWMNVNHLYQSWQKAISYHDSLVSQIFKFYGYHIFSFILNSKDKSEQQHLFTFQNQTLIK
ncbi:hypothetical protein TTHERM_000773257 (macronuclear) [Tetrahymena thermophila SB210]|uniref:Uncharacterized protein n=1 Tax=Tetrahymena thermophila (strain SB210) TaxID=312017 RepID=W7WZY2_TETTS|nr:hypothetical protein TTHERM_000773257 [Tetrahymena thermophila SB210]EWS72415.1 hypothetical protein TTHERM_000773257 [Tetrahymena thermophila SB210]|eukprot:XP_012655042.1 hypothetical protein TTHERM_000773257 [Tetrahymena thermophila SB210]